MPRWWPAISLALAMLFAFGEARGETVDELDARLEAELAAANPDAVAPFHAANAARLAGDFVRARELFGEVMELAPDFHAATRRACQAEFELKHRDEALALCRRAVEREGSPLDDVTLAIVLVTPPATTSERAEARTLSRRAMQNAAGDAYVVASACEVAQDAQDFELLQAAADSFDAKTNDSRELVCKAIAAATRGDFDDAEELAERAERAGAPADVAAHLSEAIRAARPVDARVLLTVLRVAATFAGALVSSALLALGVGALVSWSARRERSVSRGLGVFSRFSLWLFAVAATLAIPAFVATALVVVGVSTQRLLRPGGVSNVLVAASALALVSTIGARKLLRRRRVPGLRLARAEQPRLFALVDEAAARVGAPAIDAVYLTPDVEVSAFERARLAERLLYLGERAVVIGAGGLADLGATELGVLVGVKTAELATGGAGGAFARTIRRAVGDKASLRQSWWFIRLLWGVFDRASRGAIVADRRTSRARVDAAYGPEVERLTRLLDELRERHAALEAEEGDEPASPDVREAANGPDAWTLFEDRPAIERAVDAHRPVGS